MYFLTMAGFSFLKPWVFYFCSGHGVIWFFNYFFAADTMMAVVNWRNDLSCRVRDPWRHREECRQPNTDTTSQEDRAMLPKDQMPAIYSLCTMCKLLPVTTRKRRVATAATRGAWCNMPHVQETRRLTQRFVISVVGVSCGCGICSGTSDRTLESAPSPVTSALIVPLTAVTYSVTWRPCTARREICRLLTTRHIGVTSIGRNTGSLIPNIFWARAFFIKISLFYCLPGDLG